MIIKWQLLCQRSKTLRSTHPSRIIGKFVVATWAGHLPSARLDIFDICLWQAKEQTPQWLSPQLEFPTVLVEFSLLIYTEAFAFPSCLHLPQTLG